ncbi:MAG: signal peptidase II [Verrucomicrobiia bacterium]
MSEPVKNKLSPGKTIAISCAIVAMLDQISKLAVIEILSLHEDKNIIDGFFRLVYWGNTGAAWSLFRDNNELLTIISLIALLFLFINRNKFEIKTRTGQVAMGMIFGGIIGNITDRLLRGHVVDFLYFYVVQRSGNELGFPAFNFADLSICTGVGIMLVLIFIKKDDQILSHNNENSKSFDKETLALKSQDVSRESTSDK